MQRNYVIENIAIQYGAMAMMFRRTYIIGIHLLITSQISYSLVLLSANIDDVRRLAMQFMPAPLAEQIANLISKATLMKSPDISGENIRNGLAKLSYINWNDAEQRGILDTSEEERYRNHISVKRGRDIPHKVTDLTTSMPTIVDRKKNYVYDYALKQDSMKKPKFEWQKGANYEFAVLTNQGPLFVTTPAYLLGETTKSNLRIITDVDKKTVNTFQGSRSKAEERKPIGEQFYPIRTAHRHEKNIQKPTKEDYPSVIKFHKPAKKGTYSNAEAHKPAKDRPYTNANKEVRKPAKEKAHMNIIKEIRKPAKENPRYKEIRKPTNANIKVKIHKSSKPLPKSQTKEPNKEENVVESESETESDINKIEIEDSSSDSENKIDSAEPTGSTRIPVDYFERAKNVKYQSEKSIYTKDVLATSGPVELLRATVKFLASSEENSLNEENKEYFKQYDSASRPDLRRHLEGKSGDEETTTGTATTQPDESKIDSEVKEVTPVGTETTHVEADTENTKASWYGGATVFNNVQTEQVTEDETKDKSK